jgi:hypothetical protein
LSDARLSQNASAAGVLETQTVWPYQRAYVFSGGNGTAERYLQLVATVADKDIEFSYANGAMPGTDWDDLTPPAASSTFAGLAALEDDNGTVLTLSNTERTRVTFTSDSSAAYNAAAGGAASAWTYGTDGLDSAAKAAQALHIAFTAAIAAGTLKMTLTPATYTAETSITLTQTGTGAAGNTTITIPANLVANGTTGAGSTPFTGGDDQVLVLETSTTGSAPWTTIWTAEAGAGWRSARVAVVGTQYVRWRQTHYVAPVAPAKSDSWAIGYIRVWTD